MAWALLEALAKERTTTAAKAAIMTPRKAYADAGTWVVGAVPAPVPGIYSTFDEGNKAVSPGNVTVSNLVLLEGGM